MSCLKKDGWTPELRRAHNRLLTKHKLPSCKTQGDTLERRHSRLLTKWKKGDGTKISADSRRTYRARY